MKQLQSKFKLMVFKGVEQLWSLRPQTDVMRHLDLQILQTFHQFKIRFKKQFQ